jgi:chromosome segregation ATPase
VRETAAALDAAGGDSKDFARTQDLIRQAAIETARALRDAAAAMDSFKGKQASGKSNVAAAAELDQFNKLAAGSGLPQAQITFISTLENKLQALQAAIVEDQASMARLNAELQANGFKSAASSAAAMKAGLDEADQAAQRLAATAGFQVSWRQDIEAGARDISRFGPQVDTAAVSAQRFADTIQSILQPTQAASASLDGLEAVIAQAEGVTDGAKRRLSEYNAELNNLQSAAAGISARSRRRLTTSASKRRPWPLPEPRWNGRRPKSCNSGPP